MSFLSQEDPEVARALELEDQRQRDCIVLIASENYASKAVLEPGSSVISNKYAEGYPGQRYYGGCENADIVESLAINRVKELFGAQHANVQEAFLTLRDMVCTAMYNVMYANGRSDAY